MKIYISGKITGLNFDQVKAKFNRAEEFLKEIDYVPVNPLKNGISQDAEWKHHMVKDIELLFSCDAIYMMDNWMDSLGASIEFDIAKRLNMPIHFESTTVRQRHEVERIKEAILEATGIPFLKYTNKKRDRDLFYCRLIFAHHCDKIGMKHQAIAQYVNRDRTSVISYIGKYDDELRFNHKFRSIAIKVIERLATPKGINIFKNLSVSL